MPDLREKIETYLSKRLQGKVQILDMKLLSGGACQENHLVKLEVSGGPEAGSYDLVMRTDRGGSLLSSLSRMNEFRIAGAAFDAGVRTPRVFWPEENADAIGAPFYFMQRINGNAAGRFIVKDRSIAEARKKLHDELAASLARLHSIKQSEKSLDLDFLPRRDARTLALEAVREIRDELSQFDEAHPAIELALNWNDQIGSDFSYNVGINGAYNKNKVGNIPTEDGIIHGDVNMLYDNSPEFYRAENGHAIGYFWGYQTAGIFQNKEQIANWNADGKHGILQSDPQPGDVIYVDQNQDGIIDDNDKVDLGIGTPDFTYGFNLGFNYKNFDFSLVAYGAAGNQIVQSYRNHANSKANYTSAILDRWTGEGTSNRIPRVTNTNINWQFSDLYIQDGDYLRISNITLGYDFAKLINVKAISQARLYFQVQNAFTFTKYDGMDPEIGYGTSDWVSGIDLGYYPRPRTFLVGVNLKF